MTYNFGMDEDIVKRFREGSKTQKIAEMLLQGKSYSDISKELGVSMGRVGAVAARVNQIRKMLELENQIKQKQVEQQVNNPTENKEEQTQDTELEKEYSEPEYSEPEEEYVKEDREFVDFVEVPDRRVYTRVLLPPEIFFKYNIWAAYVNRFGKSKWDGSFEDFLNMAVDILLKACKIEIYAVAEVDNKLVRIG